MFEQIILYNRFDPILVQLNEREKDLFNNLTTYTHLEETEDDDLLEIKNPDETEEEYEEKISFFKRKYPELKFTEESSFQIENDTRDFIGDVLGIDDIFMFPSDYGRVILEIYDIVCFVLVNENKEYLGHVWVYTSKLFPQFCGIYGMKSSIINIINRENKGVAGKLLDGVITYAKSKGCNEIVVPWPLPPMAKLLKKLGYKEFNTQELTPERQFLKNITATSNYFTLSIN